MTAAPHKKGVGVKLNGTPEVCGLRALPQMLSEGQKHCTVTSRRRLVRCMLVGRCYYQPQLTLTVDTPIQVVREPTNAHDPNACMVVVRVDGEWRHVGYIERSVAKLLTNVLVHSTRAVFGGRGNVPLIVEVEQFV